jgi:colanic acid/amylovoran biosynthesis glycosyltransferase
MIISHVVTQFLNLTERFMLEQMLGLMEAGNEIHIFSLRPPPNKMPKEVYKNNFLDKTCFFSPTLAFNPEGIINFAVLFGRGLLERELSIHAVYNSIRLAAYAKIIRKKDIELVQVHYGSNGKNFVPLKALLNIPIVTYFYGLDVGFLMREHHIYDRLFREGDLILVICEDMRKILVDSGCPREKIKKVPIGIDCDRIRYVEREEKDSVEFLTVARFVEKKGIEFGIKAFAEVHKRYPNTKLKILGDGPLAEKLSKLTVSLGLSDSIEFINNFAYPNPREVVLNNYYSSDVFLLPSVSVPGDYGGTPTVLLEAQASGLPCITTNDAGNPEIVINGETGFVVNQRDIEALVEKMTMLVEDRELRRRFGEKGREHIEKNYNKNVQIKKLVEIYKVLIEEYGDKA